MKRWHFVFSRRWLGYFAFAVAFAIACVFLSHWQLDRSHQAAEANALVARNFDAPARPLADVLPRPGAYRPGQEWKRVTATGVYQKQDQLLVRNRATDAGPGFEVLTPLRLEDGTLFIVDRGWVPTASRGSGPAHVAPAPSGTVTVTVRLKPGEPALEGRHATGNQIPSIDLDAIHGRLGTTMYSSAYGLLQSQTPEPATELTPVVSQPPNQNTGLHWSYMIQWLIFAAIGFFGVGYAVRTEYRKRYEDEPDMQRKARERAERAARRKRTDAEIEDELLDAGAR